MTKKSISNLAKILSNYYKKKANKKVFINGMTLNKLAVAMWEKLGYKKMDESILSKVINGKRLFTKQQLNAFCKVLNLKQWEIRSLQRALMQDILVRSMLISEHEIILTAKSQIEVMILNIEKLALSVKVLRERGQPNEAITTASIARDLEEFMLNSYPKKAKLHLNSFATVYNEEALAWAETLVEKHKSAKIAYSNSRKVTSYKEMKSRRILNDAKITFGGGYYLDEEWEKGAQYYDLIFDDLDEKNKLLCCRQQSLCYASMLDKENYYRVRKKGLKLIENNQYGYMHDAVSMLEAFARSLTILGKSDEALDVLEEAESLYKIASSKYGERPFFEAQIIRGKIYALTTSKLFDVDRILALSKRYLEPKFIAYSRHTTQINNILKLSQKC